MINIYNFIFSSTKPEEVIDNLKSGFECYGIIIKTKQIKGNYSDDNKTVTFEFDSFNVVCDNKYPDELIGIAITVAMTDENFYDLLDVMSKHHEIKRIKNYVIY